MTPLLLHGMHGLGDACHSRAIIRELKRDYEVWYATSWPEMMHDMPDVHLLPRKSPIAWMAKNEIRSAKLYGTSRPPPGAKEMSIGYLSWMPKGIKDHGSVLGMMASVCGLSTVGDFRLPIKPEWAARADAVLANLAPPKPLLIYRPLIQINEANIRASQAKIARNPDFAGYGAMFAAIRDRYYVVSLADVREGVEWLVGPQIKADAEFHNGELEFETLAALFARAALVFCSPGFALVLAQAVGTPMVAVFGGFEDARSFSAGARYSPWLPIEPVNPCACWSHGCTHDKTIDLPVAQARIEQFITERACKSS